MDFYHSYNNDHEQDAYNFIISLGAKAFLPAYRNNIEHLMHDLFTRVQHNLQVIHTHLIEVNYCLNNGSPHSFDQPFLKSFANTEQMLKSLNKAVEPFGYIPLSLQYFYRYVGGINFAWNYEAKPDIRWPMADALQIMSLDSLLKTVTDRYWAEEMQDYIEEGLPFGLAISADDLHKDNVSGGPMYAIAITPEPSVDSLLLYESHNLLFIDYLRLCFKYAGFPGLTDNAPDDFVSFSENVKLSLRQF